MFRYFGPPGTGKTTTLINQVEKALAAGVLPNQIGFFSFTRKAAEEELTPDDKDGIGRWSFQDADTSKLSEYQKYMRENYYDLNEDPYAGRPINWDEDIEWGTEDYPDQLYAEVMDSIYLPPEYWYDGEMKIDVQKLVYSYVTFDAEAAARINV